MSELTLDQLKTIMREAAGEDGGAGLDRDILDVPFADLGFDSLALLETVTLVKRRTGVAIKDHELEEIGTPRALLAKVSTTLAGAA